MSRMPKVLGHVVVNLWLCQLGRHAACFKKTLHDADSVGHAELQPPPTSMTETNFHHEKVPQKAAEIESKGEGKRVQGTPTITAATTTMTTTRTMTTYRTTAIMAPATWPVKCTSFFFGTCRFNYSNELTWFGIETMFNLCCEAGGYSVSLCSGLATELVRTFDKTAIAHPDPIFCDEVHTLEKEHQLHSRQLQQSSALFRRDNTTIPSLSKRLVSLFIEKVKAAPHSLNDSFVSGSLLSLGLASAVIAPGAALLQLEVTTAMFATAASIVARSMLGCETIILAMLADTVLGSSLEMIAGTILPANIMNLITDLAGLQAYMNAGVGDLVQELVLAPIPDQYLSDFGDYALMPKRAKPYFDTHNHPSPVTSTSRAGSGCDSAKCICKTFPAWDYETDAFEYHELVGTWQAWMQEDWQTARKMSGLRHAVSSYHQGLPVWVNDMAEELARRKGYPPKTRFRPSRFTYSKKMKYQRKRKRLLETFKSRFPWDQLYHDIFIALVPPGDERDLYVCIDKKEGATRAAYVEPDLRRIVFAEGFLTAYSYTPELLFRTFVEAIALLEYRP